MNRENEIKFNMRKVGLYLDVTVKIGGAKFEFGFHTADEAQALLNDLQLGINELDYFLELSGAKQQL